MSATIYAIGLGPGDPELITVKARRLISELPALYLPVRDGHSGVTQRIAEQVAPAGKLQQLRFRFSKKAGDNIQEWRRHAQTLAEAAASRGRIGLLVEGDPLLYSAFGLLLDELRQAHPDVVVEFVPGVTAVTAAAAVRGLPLGQANERLAIVPASGDVLHALATFDTVVIIKVSLNWDGVLKALRTTGRTSEARYVARAGLPEQRLVDDVESLKTRQVDYLAEVIVSR